MKRWAILTVAFYAISLLLLTLPVSYVCGLKWSWAAHPSSFRFELPISDILEFYTYWGYWIWFGVLVGGQALLLYVPLQIRQQKLIPRRHIFVPVITTSFLLANLCFTGAFSLLCLGFGDKAYEFIAEIAKVGKDNPLWQQTAARAGWSPGDDDIWLLVVVLSILSLLWMIWAYIFYFMVRLDDPNSTTRRVERWLLRASFLQILVAVSSHIVVRGRGDCCAPMATFWGIATGLSILLLSFGPGVFFLFTDRANRLRPRPQPAAPVISQPLQPH